MLTIPLIPKCVGTYSNLARKLFQFSKLVTTTLIALNAKFDCFLRLIS